MRPRQPLLSGLLFGDLAHATPPRAGSSERGQTLVLAAFSMCALLGLLAFATDVGLMFIDKGKLQVAADSAALAGAAEMNYGDYVSAATAMAAQNGFTNGSNGVVVSVNPSGTSTPSPLYGPYAGQSGYMEVIVSQVEPTYFMQIFNYSSMTVSARSVASLGQSQACLYVLAKTGTSITFDNGPTLAANCAILDNSSSATAVSVTDGGTLSASSIGVVGDVSSTNGTVSPAAATGIAPFSDPLAYLAPPAYTASSCTSDPGSHYQGGATYSVGPGSTYSTTQSGNLVCYTSLSLGANGDKVTVNPGIYVITGSLSTGSGTITGGNGVTFYITGSSSVVDIANGSTMSLTAPTSGAYNGILFYQDRADTSGATFAGGANSVLKGILYFPDAPLLIDNGSATTSYTPIIASTLTVEGSKLTLADYSTVNGLSPLTSARTVE